MDKKEYNRQYHAKNKEKLNARSLAWYYQNQGQVDRAAKSAYLKKYYLANKEKFVAYRKRPEVVAQKNAERRAKYAANPEYRQKLKDKVKAYQTNNPHQRKRQRLRTYSMELEHYEQMLLSQRNCCAICGHSDMTKPKFFPMVDHCHNSMKVRGLLCMNCNQGLGKFKDNPALLRIAALYLENNGSSGAISTKNKTRSRPH